MPYSIKYITNSRVLASEDCDDFDSAKTLAKAAVSAGTANRVEIVDQSGTLMWYQPRSMRLT